jgi:hypothetical protein
MSVGGALRRALRDFYDNSLRLLVLNTTLSLVAIAILLLALQVPVALLLLCVLGPLAAALMHCALIVAAGEGDIRLGQAVQGLRLHWRRGLALALLAAAALVLSIVAVNFYAGAGTRAWPLAVLALYGAALFAIYQLSLWPLAVLERQQPLGAVLRAAALALLRRPAGWTGLGIALLLINILGIAAGVLPFLTMTIAYSFLAVARFALPPGRSFAYGEA